MASGKPMLLTEPMNRILNIDVQAKTIELEAGATWNNIHHAIQPYGLATLVQQSSAHFTVGGSISVNCHGRDPVAGTIANTIVWLDVLTPNRGELRVVPGSPLFKAVVGGYGSCGLILRACLQLKTSKKYLKQVSYEMSISAYIAELFDRERSNTWAAYDLHYVWLNFSNTNMFESVLSVDCAETTDLPKTKLAQIGRAHV